ncbi:SSU ribosomal protein S8P [Ferrithrix thermotolerans DSM 19514]|jgi:small subunit ribosomal protein S8|uniref:Small ribosomal subunit protein uS8 n=1 Tax=Ferrithrix thermotolerans DSM 19514 TaxID=1121881 RepID=A0A1M4STC1_9ACTN|nr:30S ribosomal protein S8 [Ferrithrix thermotolerans]SHE35392.1 SSU ribosomal protein S8P [Ferrithrix thermotolerans DSM 19514]
MSMSDPIADMLTRIRNASSAKHEKVLMPGSKVKENLAKILEKEGFIAGYRMSDAADRPGSVLEVTLKYSPTRQAAINGIQRVSKPGLRVYRRADAIPRVLGGLGVAVLSTSKGLMTDREARKAHMGGEVICYVW